jgi:hypothetical protein
MIFPDCLARGVPTKENTNAGISVNVKINLMITLLFVLVK